MSPLWANIMSPIKITSPAWTSSVGTLTFLYSKPPHLLFKRRTNVAPTSLNTQRRNNAAAMSSTTSFLCRSDVKWRRGDVGMTLWRCLYDCGDVGATLCVSLALLSVPRKGYFIYIFWWMLHILRNEVDTNNLGPVVQSVVSLTSSLRVISLTVLADSIYNILIFFAEKMWVAFAVQKLLTFFSAKNFSIFAYHSM